MIWVSKVCYNTTSHIPTVPLGQTYDTKILILWMSTTISDSLPMNILTILTWLRSNLLYNHPIHGTWWYLQETSRARNVAYNRCATWLSFGCDKATHKLTTRRNKKALVPKVRSVGITTSGHDFPCCFFLTSLGILVAGFPSNIWTLWITRKWALEKPLQYVKWTCLKKRTGWWFSNMSYFHPYGGKWSNFTNVFQMGWNHQQEETTNRLL